MLKDVYSVVVETHYVYEPKALLEYEVEVSFKVADELVNGAI